MYISRCSGSAALLLRAAQLQQAGDAGAGGGAEGRGQAGGAGAGGGAAGAQQERDTGG